jgi:DNA-binding transcriptional ArsR family regulator
MNTMLDAIILSKTRIKLLIKLFLIKNSTAYIRAMETQFGESVNAIRMEVNRLEKAKLITSSYEGNKKIFKANTKHPLYNDITRIVRTTVGIDHIIDKIVKRAGDLDSAYITGSFATGVDSEVIDLVLVGRKFNTEYIDQLVEKAEQMISRRIMYLTLTPDQMDYFFKNRPALLIWSKDE